MYKEKIIVPKGIRYIGEKNLDGYYKWKEFDLEHCNHPYILNKTLTGCGFTEYCLTNDKDIVLISPRRFLLENKEEQHEGEVYYFRNDNENSADFEFDVNKEDSSSLKEEEETEESRNKTVENLNRIKNNLREAYLEFKEKNPGKSFKILVTYDSFKYVKDVLKNLPGDELSNFFYVVDEFQSIFIDARFKSEAEIGLLKELEGIEKICFVSATPMLDKYLEMLYEFKSLPYYYLDWETDDPGRVKKPKIEVKFTRSLNEEAKRVIDSYKNEKYDIRIDPKTKGIIESKEAVLFFNSVSGICQVIRTNRLHLEECNVICANTQKNHDSVKRAFNSVLKKEAEEEGKKLKYLTKKDKIIGKIPTKGQPHKKFTFCTRTVYLGADFYSTNARSFVFCDANIECLSVDISMDLEQILGRQRLKENPWKDYAKVFVRTLSEKNVITPEEYNIWLNTKKKTTNQMLETFDDTKEKNKDTLAKNYLKIVKVYHYRDDYVSVSTEKDWSTGKIISWTPEFNNLMMISDMRAFEIQQIDYKDRFTVFNAIDQTSIEGASAKSREMLEEFNRTGNTSKRLRFLVEISENDTITPEDISSFLEMIPGKYKDYYTIVGPKIIKACGCIECEIKKRWRKEVTGDKVDERVITRMGDLFKVGEKYSNHDVKKMLKNLYQELDYNKTAKTTDLDLIFIVRKEIKIKDSDGKWVNGLEIIGKR